MYLAEAKVGKEGKSSYIFWQQYHSNFACIKPMLHMRKTSRNDVLPVPVKVEGLTEMQLRLSQKRRCSTKYFSSKKKESTIPMIIKIRLCILSCSIEVGKTS